MRNEVKRCETCEADRIPGERYCKSCRKVIIDRMRRDKYLAWVPGRGQPRTPEMREDVRETRLGTDR